MHRLSAHRARLSQQGERTMKMTFTDLSKASSGDFDNPDTDESDASPVVPIEDISPSVSDDVETTSRAPQSEKTAELPHREAGGLMSVQQSIDRTRAGTLRVTPQFLAQLLRAPAIDCRRAFANKTYGVVDLVIEGAAMPPRPANGEPPEAVSLIVRHIEKDGIHTIYLAWAHAPDDEWLLGYFPSSVTP